MTKTPSKDGCPATKQRDIVRYVYEILFSSNVAFVVPFALLVFVRTRRSARPSIYADLFLGIVSAINRSFHLDQWNDFGVKGSFTVLLIGLMLFFFLLVRLLAVTAWSNAVLHPVVAMVALAAVPGCWVYINELFRPRHEGASIALYLFGLETISVCALLLFARKSVVPLWCSGLFLILHYSLWAWVVWPRFSADLDPAPAFSIVSPSFGLAWALYLKRLPKVPGQ